MTVPDTLERDEVTAGGRRVAVYRSGDGPVHVLALHGGFTDPVLDWAPLAPYLDERLSVVMPVLRGHDGEPVRGGTEIGPLSVADDAAALVEALGWDRPVLAGFSLGARAAMLAAARGVATPALVLVGPRFRAFDAGEFSAMREQVEERSPGWRGRASALEAMAAGIVDFAIEPDAWAAALGDVPVLVVRGARDRISTEEEMARFPGSARVVHVAGHGHRVQATAPDEVASLIGAFLSDAGVL